MARYSGARTWKSSVMRSSGSADRKRTRWLTMVPSLGVATSACPRLLDRVESRWSSRRPYASNVEYEVLGHLRVLDKNGAEVQLSAPKLRTLLALLLVNRGRP